MKRPVCISVIVGSIVFFMLGWLSFQPILDMVVADRELKLFTASVENMGSNRFYMALSMMPVGAAIVVGYLAPRNIMKGMMTTIAAIAGATMMIVYMRGSFSQLQDGPRTVEYTPGLPIPYTPVVPGSMIHDVFSPPYWKILDLGGYIYNINLYYVGVAASLCAVAVLVAHQYWTRRTARAPVVFCGVMLLLATVATVPVQAVQAERQRKEELTAEQAAAAKERLEKIAKMEKERLRLEKRDMIRSSQAELRRLGCYHGEANGHLDDATRDALKRAYAARGPAGIPLEIDEAVLSNLKTLKGPICIWPGPPPIQQNHLDVGDFPF